MFIQNNDWKKWNSCNDHIISNVIINFVQPKYIYNYAYFIFRYQATYSNLNVFPYQTITNDHTAQTAHQLNDSNADFNAKPFAKIRFEWGTFVLCQCALLLIVHYDFN